MILPEYVDRLKELFALAEKNDDEMDAAKDEAEKQELIAQGWEICSRIWLYRGESPLLNFASISQMESYLKYLLKEISKDLQSKPDSRNEKARLNEVRIAQQILSKYPKNTRLTAAQQAAIDTAVTEFKKKVRC